MRSGIERLSYAVSIIVMATLVGWMVAECVGLAPDDFAPLGLSPLALTLLRVAMSFVGVFGFSVMFNSPVKMAAAAGLIGAVSNTLRLTLVDAPTLFSLLGPECGHASRGGAFTGALVSGLLASLAETSSPTHASPSRCHRLSLWCRACICIARCITCAPSTRSICSAGLCVQCSSWRFCRWSGCGAYAHRPSLAPHQLIGAGGQVTLYQMSCGEIGTELLLKGSKQSVFHRNLWGRGITGALHLHKLNAYEARAFRARLVPPHK